MSDKLLEIRDLKKHFPVMKGLIFQKPVGLVKARVEENEARGTAKS